MNRFQVMIALFLSCALFSPVFAADPSAGKAKAATCAACHGQHGVSANEQWPNLAGQKQGYLRKQLTAFRDGTRSDGLMSPMAKPLTDEDIANLAAYYASLKTN